MPQVCIEGLVQLDKTPRPWRSANARQCPVVLSSGAALRRCSVVLAAATIYYIDSGQAVETWVNPCIAPQYLGINGKFYYAKPWGNDSSNMQASQRLSGYAAFQLPAAQCALS